MPRRADVLDALVSRFYRLAKEAEERHAQRLREPESAKSDVRTGSVSTSLTRLRRGEISWGDYLEAKIDEVLLPLADLVDAEDTAFLRALGRDYLDRELARSGFGARICEGLAAPDAGLGDGVSGFYTEEAAMDRRKHTAERLAPSQGSPELQRLKLGEIDVDEYIELRLDVAIVRLGRLVSEDQRSLLRQLIREQCLTDPVVQEYVRRAMGRINP